MPSAPAISEPLLAKYEPVIAKALGNAKLAPQAEADSRERLAFMVTRS